MKSHKNPSLEPNSEHQKCPVATNNCNFFKVLLLIIENTIYEPLKHEKHKSYNREHKSLVSLGSDYHPQTEGSDYHPQTELRVFIEYKNT